MLAPASPPRAPDQPFLRLTPGPTLGHPRHASATPMASSRSKNGKPCQVANNASGASTSADTMRRIRSRRDLRGAAIASAGDGAISPLPAAELGDGGGELGLAEIRPQR